jgi:hypothetical protein
VHVELRPFNDRTLNRDLAMLCERVNQASPRLPDGRLLSYDESCLLPFSSTKGTLDDVASWWYTW